MGFLHEFLIQNCSLILNPEYFKYRALCSWFKNLTKFGLWSMGWF